MSRTNQNSIVFTIAATTAALIMFASSPQANAQNRQVGKQRPPNNAYKTRAMPAKIKFKKEEWKPQKQGAKPTKIVHLEVDRQELMRQVRSGRFALEPVRFELKTDPKDPNAVLILQLVLTAVDDQGFQAANEKHPALEEMKLQQKTSPKDPDQLTGDRGKRRQRRR